MPQKSGFFDSTADDMREYPAREFAEYFARFVGNGVFLGGTQLKVTATGQDANVNVELGYGWINGYMYSVYDEPLTMPIEPATTQDRIDRVILRLDTSAPVRAIRALVVQGLSSASPQPPALVRSGNIYDLSLAQIKVIANTTVVKPENITDERLNNQVCGIVTALIDQADTTSIFNQFQAWLNTKTVEYQQQWDDFMQSVQDEGFATTDYVDNRVLTGGFGVTTNSENAYSVTPSPAPTALVAGLRVTVRINAANTAAATLNVNGLGAKSILKGNGNAVAAGNLKANSVYTLVYSGSAFILQGEGGEYGTATAADVLAPKTIGTDNGIVTGTIPNRGDGGSVTPGTTNQSKASGYYSSPITILGSADLIPANIKKNISIFGVLGTLEPKLYYEYKQAVFSGSYQMNIPFIPKVISMHALMRAPGSGLGDYYYYVAVQADYPDNQNNVKTALSSGTISNDGTSANRVGLIYLRNPDNVSMQPMMPLASNLIALSGGTATIYEFTIKAWA